MTEVQKKEPRYCKICRKKLKRFTAQEDWDERIYHKKCFDEIVSDIAKYNTVAYTKYGHAKRMINGMTIEEAKKEKCFIITFD
jgi:hypothetical protein